MEFVVTATSIETLLWHIQRELMDRHGCDAASREIAPLRWYVDTGRASTPCIKKMMEAKPFMLARKLHQGGSTSEIINRIRKYI